MNSHDPCDAQAPAWRTRFDALVQQRMTTPFEWGRHDCCLWAADAALATTGVDHAHAVRGTYQTAQQATTVLQRLGGLEAVAGQAGVPIAPLQATTADIGLVVVEGREALAVCVGPAWLVAAAQGLGVVPLEACIKAWRVARA